MTTNQKRQLAKKIYQEIHAVIDKWYELDFIKIHWNGDITVDGEHFEGWRLANEKEEN